MTKRIAAVILCVVAVFTLSSCGKKVECDLCGETKTGTTKTVFGEKISVCNDCIDELNEW